MQESIHPISGVMQTALENIKDMIDVNTVVGEPMVTGSGSTVIPVSKVSFGFVAGGGEYNLPQPDATRPFAPGMCAYAARAEQAAAGAYRHHDPQAHRRFEGIADQGRFAAFGGAEIMKRFAAVLFFFIAFLYNGYARADAAAAVVLEAQTGRVLYAVNETQTLPMASTTKIMTALVALENADLSDIVTTGDNAYGIPGTSIYLQKGEQLTLEQMLYGLMLASGNDAAVAIAEHVGGSVSGFCDMMNARARQIGCENTHFVTPHGLPAQQHYTTAYDLALIAREAMKNADFRRIVSTQHATIPWHGHDYDRVLTNKNRLLSAYPGALGIKTGYTRAAGRCLAFAAERDGMTLIGTVLACPDWFTQAAALLDQTFDRYEMYQAMAENETVAQLPVLDGVTDWVGVTLRQPLSGPVAKGTIPSVRLTLPESLQAGFGTQEAIGVAELIDGDATIATALLYPAQSVGERTFLTGLGQAVRDWLVLGE